MNQNVVKLYLKGCQLFYRVASRSSINKSIVKGLVQVKQSGNHVFRGYYDINYIDESRQKHLLHILSERATSKDHIGIGYYDFTSNEIITFAESKVWCWQQGSRLRWFDSNRAIFNDTADGRHIARIVDVNTGDEIGRTPVALYDINKESGIGVGLNFSRLQRLRPGYGYSVLEDVTIGDIGSTSDGIYTYNFNSNEVKLILRLGGLREIACATLSGEDYVNHLCLSPKGDKLMFFYIVTEKWQRNKVYLMCSDISGENCYVLENQVQSSHYCWVDNDNLLVTYIDFEHQAKQGYRIYNTSTGEFKDYASGILSLDGHPTWVGHDSIIADTYPQKSKMNNQYLYLYNGNNRKLVEIGRFFQDIRYTGEQRCDLHPSISQNIISIDTSCDGLRSVFIIDMNILSK